MYNKFSTTRSHIFILSVNIHTEVQQVGPRASVINVSLP